MRSKESPKVPHAVLLILTILGSALVILPVPVFANPGGTTWCGHTITASITLTANIGPCSGNGLVIGANGITLNCAGHTITGTVANTKAGIYLSGKTKVTVKNCHVAAFRYGIEVLGSSYNAFTGNTANSNHYDGFYVSSSSYDTFTKNAANSNSFAGFFLFSSSHNALGTSVALSGNSANSNTKYGFHLYKSSRNTLTKNTAAGNTDGFGLFSSSSNTFTSNRAYGNCNGFYLDSASKTNTIADNFAYHNANFGYFDHSLGRGTLGTANTYLGNECMFNGAGGSSPHGLGAPQP